MAVVSLWRGAITVTDPPESLKEELTYWKKSLGFDARKHMRTMTGSYEHLYTVTGNTLTTLPGFGHRILDHLRKLLWPHTVVDRRNPLPAPDIEKACDGMRDYQIEPVVNALLAGGGLISLPTGYGKTRIAAALVRAFDPEQLKLRGTPTCVFAAPDKDINRKNWEEFCKIFPDRDVGIIMSGVNKPSDDIQIITLDSLHYVNPSEVGVLIVDEVHTAASEDRSESLARFSKAVRYGVSATPGGRFDGGDLLTEGLFGPVVVRRTYQDAVKLGALVPIEVYWIKAPKPHVGMQYYQKYRTRDAKIRSAIVSNPDYSKVVASLINRIPEDKKVLCFTQWIKQMANIHAYCPSCSYVHGQTNEGLGTVKAIKAKERKAIYDRFASGEIRKIMATYCWRQGADFPDLDIVINASGGGSDITAKQIPGRASRKADGKERAYVVDFTHDWDWEETETGRRKPGPLMACDMARKRSYRDLGFVQHSVESIEDLPFIGRN